MGIGHEIGLVTDEQYEKLQKKEAAIEAEIKRLEGTNIGASKDVQDFLERNGSTLLKTGTTLA